MSRTMILFLSVYNGYPEAKYETDLGSPVKGTQTNEAPFRYAVRRLKDAHNKIDRIIALVTTKAGKVMEKTEKSAWEMFSETVDAESPGTKICRVCITDDVTATDLLQKTLDALGTLTQKDSIIIETTGGFRNSINALTLLTRFLSYIRINVEFSTYADYFSAPKRVTDTSEIDGLFDLLDAVNRFATTGNTDELNKQLGNRKSAEETAFFQASQKFYASLITCGVSRIKSDIIELRTAIAGLKSTVYGTGNAGILIFRELVMTVVEQKMSFLLLSSGDLIIDLVRWCAINGYLQQAITILWEHVKGNSNAVRILRTYSYYNVLGNLRNFINHTDENPYFNGGASREEKDQVTRLLEDPKGLKEFIIDIIENLKLSLHIL